MSFLPRQKRLEAGVPDQVLPILRLDDTVMLSQLVIKVAKIKRLIYCGDLNKSLCELVKNYSDKIEIFEAEDWCLFAFE